MSKMTRAMEEIIAEAKENYSRMYLLKLLAHENWMNKLMYSAELEPTEDIV
jgi:hypothetical protein